MKHARTSSFTPSLFFRMFLYLFKRKTHEQVFRIHKNTWYKFLPQRKYFTKRSMKIEFQNYFTKRLQYIHYTGYQTASRGRTDDSRRSPLSRYCSKNDMQSVVLKWKRILRTKRDTMAKQNYTAVQVSKLALFTVLCVTCCFFSCWHLDTIGLS